MTRPWIETWFHEPSGSPTRLALGVGPDALVVDWAGEVRRFSLAPPRLDAWCLAMRALGLAIGRARLDRGAFPDLEAEEWVDPDVTCDLGVGVLALRRNRPGGLVWRVACGEALSPGFLVAIQALARSPRLFLGAVDPRRDAGSLWPFPPSPQRLPRAIDVSGRRIVDVVGEGDLFLTLILDLDALTLTPLGSPAQRFDALPDLFAAALRLREVLHSDPWVVQPVAERFGDPPQGHEPWFSAPDLEVFAPEFDGVHWKCNRVGPTGELRASFGHTPLELLGSVVDGAASVTRRAEQERRTARSQDAG